MMQDLFSGQAEQESPLAERMRPRNLDEFIGQEHIVGKGKILRRAILSDRVGSSIFFGPPGTGKTTLACLVADASGGMIEKLNAVSSGVKELREILAGAEKRLRMFHQPTYLLLDECHRWSKAQSDALLPALERGIVRLIGSTTENPMISMTGAIVSRCRVYQFLPLTAKEVETAILRALRDPDRGFGNRKTVLENEALHTFSAIANGDCRTALNALEIAVLTTEPDAEGTIRITQEIALDSSQRKVTVCDESQFYDMLSAFCKSLRGGDSDAALAWFSRMIYAGVDPRIPARRLVVHASEDVGLANPQALVQAVAASQALEQIGMPEAGLALAQAIIFVCESPKSNSVALAEQAAMADAETCPDEPVPVHLRDTAYSGAAKLGAGTGYKYPHDYPGHWVYQEYMPPSLLGRKYYRPSDQGQEAKIQENHLRREKFRREVYGPEKS